MMGSFAVALLLILGTIGACLVVVDVLRQGRAAKVWRPDPPRLEDLP